MKTPSLKWLAIVLAGGLALIALYLGISNHGITAPHGPEPEGGDSGPGANRAVTIAAPSAMEKSAETGVASPRRDRDMDLAGRNAKADRVAKQLIAVAAKSLASGSPNEADQNEALDLIEEITRFDSKQLVRTVGIVRDDPGLDGTAKAETLGLLLPQVAQVDPAMSLDLFADLRPLFAGHEDILPAAKFLSLVARKDPAVAAAWVEKHGGAGNPDFSAEPVPPVAPASKGEGP
jgi:hypothetical protein